MMDSDVSDLEPTGAATPSAPLPDCGPDTAAGKETPAPPLSPTETSPSPQSFRLRWRRAVLIAVIGLAVTTAWLGAGRFYRYDSPQELAAGEAVAPVSDDELRELDAQALASMKRLRSLAPRSLYIVVDTAQNRLFVRKGDTVLLEAVCSTGSGGRLKDPNSDRQWVFETPRGIHHVRKKARDPVWTKPDWAFIEEAKPVPGSWSERRDYDTLGDYALYFGDGYMIHGTLYQRYLGRAITHGCIRLGDDDLRRVYEMTPVGAPIYIY